ncbi:MAG: hypothetical protein ABW020_03265, partial [Candidatus Rokuibacteriota bacterium]
MIVMSMTVPVIIHRRVPLRLAGLVASATLAKPDRRDRRCLLGRIFDAPRAPRTARSGVSALDYSPSVS